MNSERRTRAYLGLLCVLCVPVGRGQKAPLYLVTKVREGQTPLVVSLSPPFLYGRDLSQREREREASGHQLLC